MAARRASPRWPLAGGAPKKARRMEPASRAARAILADAGTLTFYPASGPLAREVLDRNGRTAPLGPQTVELVPVDGRLGVGRVVAVVATAAAVVDPARQPARQAEGDHAGRDEQRAEMDVDLE